MALSLFRAAAILAGVGARAKLGNASSERAAAVGSIVICAARTLQLQAFALLFHLQQRMTQCRDDTVPVSFSQHSVIAAVRYEVLYAERRSKGLLLTFGCSKVAFSLSAPCSMT